MGTLAIPLEQIDMLSIGTAGLPTIVDDPAVEGMVGWGPKVPDLFMNAQMDATLDYARHLLAERFVRVDDHQPREEALDNVSKIDYLIERGQSVGQSSINVVMERFINGVPVQPWRTA